MTDLVSVEVAGVSPFKANRCPGGGGGRTFRSEPMPLPRAQEKISPVRGTLTSDIELYMKYE